MSVINTAVLEVADPTAARQFVSRAFGIDAGLDYRHGQEPSSGFRGFTLSVVVDQPTAVDRLAEAASAAGGTVLKPAAKSLWGYGGVVQAPDGTIWTLASSSKKDTAPPRREVDDLVLQLGVADVGASKRFYVERGFVVGSSYGRKYADFEMPSSPVKLALLKRRALAKTAGVSPEGSGSHRLVVTGPAGPFTDPDGFVWESS